MKAIVVGQTPPPYGGQAIMIKYLIDANLQDIEIEHVRMCFSKDFTERGKFSLYKIKHLFSIIKSIWNIKLTKGADILYYPLSSAPKSAVLRDVIILSCTKFLFKKIVYHFHAAGISEELPKYNSLIRKLSYSILKKPTLGITSSEFNPKDGEYLKARDNVVIPLGIPDENHLMLRDFKSHKPYITILFMGLMNSTKGEGYLLEAVNELNKNGFDVRLNLAGRFESTEYQQLFFNKISEYGLKDKIIYKGVVTGIDKKNLFLESDIFCFPSFFDSESFGIVLLEAMMYQMPIIATKWRGIQSVVEDGINGWLVPIKSSNEIAKHIEYLYNNRSELEKMGQNGRRIFEEKYEISTYLKNLENAFLSI